MWLFYHYSGTDKSLRGIHQVVRLCKILRLRTLGNSRLAIIASHKSSRRPCVYKMCLSPNLTPLTNRDAALNFSVPRVAHFTTWPEKLQATWRKSVARGMRITSSAPSSNEGTDRHEGASRQEGANPYTEDLRLAMSNRGRQVLKAEHLTWNQTAGRQVARRALSDQ